MQKNKINAKSIVFSYYYVSITIQYNKSNTSIIIQKEKLRGAD